MLSENSPAYGMRDAATGRLHTLLRTRDVIEKRMSATDHLTPHHAALMSSKDMLDIAIAAVREVLNYANWYLETAEALSREIGYSFERLPNTLATSEETRLLSGEVSRVEALAVKALSEYLAGV